MVLECVCKPENKSILDMYNCTVGGHKFMGRYYCWRHLFNKIAGLRRCGYPSCIATNHFRRDGRSDSLGQWFCPHHEHSEYCRYNCANALVIWVLQQQDCPPDVMKQIYALVFRHPDPTQLEATARALHQHQQRQAGISKPTPGQQVLSLAADT